MSNEAALQMMQDAVDALVDQVGQLVNNAAGKIDTINQQAQDVSDARDAVLPAATQTLQARDQVVPLAQQVQTSAASVTTNAGAAAAAQTAAEAARDQTYALANPANSFAEGVAYSTATTGVAAFFSVRKGGLAADGTTVLSRTTFYRRTGTSAATSFGTAADGSEIDTLANASGQSPLKSITGTANAIVGTSDTVRSLVVNTGVSLIPVANNTGPATLAINFAGGGSSAAYNIIDDNGGPIGANTFRAGNTYQLRFTGSVWRITDYGDDHERIKRGTTQALVIDSVASTANAIVATTAFPSTLADGTPFLLTPIADNTGAVTLLLNGVGPFNVRPSGGGTLVAGGLKSGRKYQLNWQSTGSIFVITSDGYTVERLNTLFNKVPTPLTNVGGSANAITANSSSITQVVVDTQILFYPVVDNTGNTTLTITYPDGTASGTFSLVDAYGGQIGPGTLRAGRPYKATFSGSVWRITDYGDDHERIKKQHQKLKNVTGTNTIAATTDYPLTLDENTEVTLVPVADNTGTATLNVNQGGAFTITHGYGSAVQAGVLKAGRYYRLIWQAAGSVWKIMSYGTLRQQLLDISTLKVLSVGGTSDAITVTTDMADAMQPKSTVSFIALADNTQTAVTLNVNGTGTFPLRLNPDTPLAIGDIKAGYVITAQWDGENGNIYRLISNGQAPSGVVDQAIGQRTDPTYSLRNKLLTLPYGNVAYVGGSRVITPKDFVGTGVGSSVGNAAGADDPSVSTPLIMFMNALSAQMGSYGNLNFITENKSVGGQVISQFLDQLNASAYSLQDVVLSVIGMNDVAVASYNTGQTFFGFDQSIEALCYQVAYVRKSAHVMCTTPHMHPTRRPPISIPQDAALGYPIATYNVSVPYVFNKTAQTIYSDTFAYAPYGGGAIAVGSTLKVVTGSNAGTHVVTAISSDRKTITVAGTLVADANEEVLIKQVNLSIEDHLVPPASASYVTRDWTGNGVQLVGDVRAWHVNKRIRAAARKYGAILVDVEQAFFRGVELNGWDAMYTNPNYNHPSTLGYEIGFGVPLRAAAQSLAQTLRS